MLAATAVDMTNPYSDVSVMFLKLAQVAHSSSWNSPGHRKTIPWSPIWFRLAIHVNKSAPLTYAFSFAHSSCSRRLTSYRWDIQASRPPCHYIQRTLSCCFFLAMGWACGFVERDSRKILPIWIKTSKMPGNSWCIQVTWSLPRITGASWERDVSM